MQENGGKDARIVYSEEGASKSGKVSFEIDAAVRLGCAADGAQATPTVRSIFIMEMNALAAGR